MENGRAGHGHRGAQREAAHPPCNCAGVPCPDGRARRPGAALRADLRAALVRAAAPVRALPADTADARVVLGAEIALGGLAAATPDLGVERGAVALADRRAALRADLAVEVAAVFLARRGAPALRRLRAGARARLAARGPLGRGARGLFGRGAGIFSTHVRVPFWWGVRSHQHELDSPPGRPTIRDAALSPAPSPAGGACCVNARLHVCSNAAGIT